MTSVTVKMSKFSKAMQRGGGGFYVFGIEKLRTAKTGLYWTGSSLGTITGESSLAQ
jgi:hypothetical protein